MSQEIFVFGSNLAGRHGRGAALTAVKLYGAKRGVGEGLVGNSYALSTKDHYIRALPLGVVAHHVERFLGVAASLPNLRFLVTAVGCGLAGHHPRDVAPMFAPRLRLLNVYLPVDFCELLGSMERVSFDRNGGPVAQRG